jgi:outer membrane protein OmpA-like peptidoglycan-associated protein
MSLSPKVLLVGFSLGAAVGGCAAVAPAELNDVRAAYLTSTEGMAGKLAPTELYEAKKSLDQANQEFDAHGDSLRLRDYTYVAGRRIELANVTARTAADRERITAAVKQGVVVRDNQVKNTEAALANSREQLKDERNANKVATTELVAANAAQGQQLDAEKAARMTAEAKLAGAMKDLSTIAAVKEEARGVVITLSGSVLFATGKYELLETAKTKLDQVAEALKAESADKKMVVEGHTDNRGSDATNQPLSLNRATAVQNYLISRGVSADRISSIGLGSSRPLLDNSNAENRANNRRVEIVIQNARVTMN